MTTEELYQLIENVEKRAMREKKEIYAKWVIDNAKYKIGDIISDSYDTIRVEKISYSIFRGVIDIVYYGPLLTKRGTPRKDGERAYIIEQRIK